MKVLIVDDEQLARDRLARMLSDIPGYDVVGQAANGMQALEIVRKHHPDLVLLDMKIPGMDGIEILKRLKDIDPDIKVIIMTAYGELDMIQETKELGVLMHFAKPFDIDDLRAAVKSHLSS